MPIRTTRNAHQLLIFFWGHSEWMQRSCLKRSQSSDLYKGTFGDCGQNSIHGFYFESVDERRMTRSTGDDIRFHFIYGWLKPFTLLDILHSAFDDASDPVAAATLNRMSPEKYVVFVHPVSLGHQRSNVFKKAFSRFFDTFVQRNLLCFGIPHYRYKLICSAGSW